MQLRSRVNFSFFSAFLPLPFRATLLNELKSVDKNVSKVSENKLINLLFILIPNWILIILLDN